MWQEFLRPQPPGNSVNWCRDTTRHFVSKLVEIYQAEFNLVASSSYDSSQDVFSIRLIGGKVTELLQSLRKRYPGLMQTFRIHDETDCGGSLATISYNEDEDVNPIDSRTSIIFNLN